MPLTRMEHLLVLTDDLDGTRDFYCRALGLEVGERPPLEFPGYWPYLHGVPCVHLADREAYTGHSERLDIPASPEAVDHIAFNGTDYEEAVARLEREGVEARANAVPGAGLRQLFFEDPNGLKIEINVMSREGVRMSQDTEMVALYWTVSGPVEVHFGREWSLFDWADRCAEAKKVGFDGIGLWHADIEHQLESRSLDDMKLIFDDSGLKHIELEFIADFFVDEGTEEWRESDRLRKLLFETAAVFDAHHIKVGNIPGRECELGRVTEAYGELCADAARHTGAKILYEFMPFDPNVDSVDKALQVVEGAGADNGGVVIDTWHMGKLGISPDELRRIPVHYLGWIELSDGKYEWSEDRLDEVINRRNLPGEGVFDIQGYVDACRDHGYPGPWGVEVLSEELRNNPIDVIFKRAYDSTAAFVGGGVKGGV